MVLLPPCTVQQCGKDFRNSLKKPSPNYPYGHKTKKPRVVPAFTIQGNVTYYDILTIRLQNNYAN